MKENYALYSHYTDFEKILELVKESFPGNEMQVKEEENSKNIHLKLKGGMFSSSKNLKISFRSRITPGAGLGKAECAVSRQLFGMYNYVAALPVQEEEKRNLLLRKIETINAEFIFTCDASLNTESKTLLAKLAEEYECIIFAQPSMTFSKAPVQHFLDHSFNLVMDIEGNPGEGTPLVKIESVYFDQQAEATPAQMERKRRTEDLLRSHQVIINDHLPVIVSEEDAHLRSREEIIERIYSLVLMTAKADDVEQDHLDKTKTYLRINGLSPAEKILFEKEELTNQEKSNVLWRYECINVLLWSLGFIEELKYPSVICDVPMIMGLILEQGREEFEATSELRSTSEILDEMDKVYRMNWACTEARIKGEEPSGNLNPDIVYERHYVFYWLLHYKNQDWDDITTDT
jgi:hypothetical protein